MEEAGGAIVEKNNFARKLGSADKKTREKGLSLLVLWLSCQKVSMRLLSQIVALLSASPVLVGVLSQLRFPD
jgi:hypothetical protein